MSSADDFSVNLKISSVNFKIAFNSKIAVDNDLAVYFAPALAADVAGDLHIFKFQISF